MQKNSRNNTPLLRLLIGTVLVATILLVVALIFTPQLLTLKGTPTSIPGDDWTMYLHDIGRSANSQEVLLSPQDAHSLAPLWKFKTGAGIAATPIVAKGTVYVGSWDGYEYALDTITGYMRWRVYLGQTRANCDPPLIGITSSAMVVDNVVYVGGGDAYWYALDAYTGSVLWKVYTGDTSPDKGYYNWSSPLIYQGYAYIGIASNCDNPLVPGQLLKVDLQTHQIVAKTMLVTLQEVGAGIWTTPALDTETGTIYVSTGTQNQSWQTNSQALVAIDLKSMVIKGAWQIPIEQSGGDFDWGNSPLLLTDALGRKLVVATNKNGFTYAFKRDNINAGPIWEDQTGLSGQCPTCGQGSVSSSAFANGTLYMAGGNTIIKNIGYPGSIRAIDITTGKFKWESGVTAPIIPALAYANGLIIDAAGAVVEVRDAKSGQRLYTYETGKAIYGPPSVSHGQIFIGSLDGMLYSFGLHNPLLPLSNVHCPSQWSCQDIGSPKISGTDTFTNGTWISSGGGTGAADVLDQFHFMSQVTQGDTQVTAHLLALSVKGKTARLGLMLRQNSERNAPFYAAYRTSDGRIGLQYRTAFNGALFSIPLFHPLAPVNFIAIQRIADRLQAATSSDGKKYTLIPGGSTTLVMPFQIRGGLALSSGANDQVATSNVTNVNVSKPDLLFAPTTSSNPCPPNWSCGDIGNAEIIGDQSVKDGQWTLKGEGKDIWLAQDQFHFVWQTVPNDGTVSSHVVFQNTMDTLTKAGVMLRQGTATDAPYYAAFETPSHGLTIQYRGVQGLDGAIVTSNSVITAPHYVRIARWHNIFSTYVSPNGIQWSALGGSTIALDISGPMLGGLAITSHKIGKLSTASFDAISIIPSAIVAPTACLNDWNCTDIGYPSPQGTQFFNVPTKGWTLQGGGFDIFFQTDQFHFLWKPMTAGGSFSAQVSYDDLNTPGGSDYAKAGIMLRKNDKAGSAYYGAFLTPSHGIVVQYRQKDNANTGEATFPDAVKTAMFLKIDRENNFYVTYTSADGASWQIVDGSSINLDLGDTLMAGLAITSHNHGALRVATFQNIQM